MIFLNEIDPKKIKEFNISKGKLRAWYSILNIYTIGPPGLDNPGYKWLQNKHCKSGVLHDIW